MERSSTRPWAVFAGDGEHQNRLWGRLVIEATRISIQASGIGPEDVIEWLNDTPPEALVGLLSVTLPNSRQVRWRFAEVAKTFGILRHGVDPRKINLRP